MTESLQVPAKDRAYTLHINTYGVADKIVIYLTMPQVVPELSALYQRIGNLSYHFDYTMVSVEIDNWNGELSPWEFKEPNGKMTFAGGAKRLLMDLEQTIIPYCCKWLQIQQNKASFIIAGYSLAGLFSLWALYQTKLFQTAVSCSGSLWYPGFLEYALEQDLKEDCAIYLSLGKKEEKTGNPYMSKVGMTTQKLYKKFQMNGRVKHIVLEWNVGNHFKEPMERTAKGIAQAIKWQF